MKQALSRSVQNKLRTYHTIGLVPDILSATEFAENHSAERETDFDSAAWKKNPNAESCFQIITDAYFINQFTCLILFWRLVMSQQTRNTLSKLAK